jgi:hypothetical protein
VRLEFAGDAEVRGPWQRAGDGHPVGSRGTECLAIAVVLVSKSHHADEGEVDEQEERRSTVARASQARERRTGAGDGYA